MKLTASKLQRLNPECHCESLKLKNSKDRNIASGSSRTTSFCSRPVWTGFEATWATGRCTPQQWAERDGILPNPYYSRILWQVLKYVDIKTENFKFSLIFFPHFSMAKREAKSKCSDLQKMLLSLKPKIKNTQDILPRNHCTLPSDRQLSVIHHSLISFLCCVVLNPLYLWHQHHQPPLERLFQHSQSQCLVSSGDLPQELTRNPRSSFDKELDEISFVLHQYHPASSQWILEVTAYWDGRDHQSPPRHHGRREMPWEEGKKLLSNSLILTASRMKEVEKIKVRELNIETLSSPRFSADLSHITQMVFDALNQPLPAAHAGQK